MSTGRERSNVRPAKQTLQMRVNGQVVTIDPDTLTLKERQKVRRELSKIGYEPDDVDVLGATVWAVMARHDPALTLDEVLDSITVADLDEADASVGAPMEDDTPEG